MKYGMPSLIEFHTVEQHARLCAECGLDFFELNFALPWYQSDKLDPAELVRIRDKYGIRYTLHLHDQLNPFDFAPELRRGALENVSYALDMAERLNARRITMHLLSGTYSAVNGVKVYAYDVCEDEYLQHVREFVDLCDSRIKDPELIFCIENTSGFRDFHKHAIEIMLRNPHFGLTFDIGHNYKAALDDESFILAHPDRLKHFHIHDVTQKSNHIALGEGVIDLPKYLDMIRRFDCSVVIEVKGSEALKKSLSYLKEHSFLV